MTIHYKNRRFTYLLTLSNDNIGRLLSSCHRNVYMWRLTLNVAECKLVARRVGVTRTGSRTRQEQFERRTIGQREVSGSADEWSSQLTIGQRVSVGSADLNDRSTWRLVLIDYWSIVGGELREVIIDVNQVYY